MSTARGVTLVDAGISVQGSIAAGLLIAQICMGGLGEVRLAPGAHEGWPSWLQVWARNQPLSVTIAPEIATMRPSQRASTLLARRMGTPSSSWS